MVGHYLINTALLDQLGLKNGPAIG